MEVAKTTTDAKHVKLAIKLAASEWEGVLDKASAKVGEGMKKFLDENLG